MYRRSLNKCHKKSLTLSSMQDANLRSSSNHSNGDQIFSLIVEPNRIFKNHELIAACCASRPQSRCILQPVWV